MNYFVKIGDKLNITTSEVICKLVAEGIIPCNLSCPICKAKLKDVSDVDQNPCIVTAAGWVPRNTDIDGYKSSMWKCDCGAYGKILYDEDGNAYRLKSITEYI